MAIKTRFSDFHKMAALNNESLVQCHIETVKASIMKSLGKASQNNKIWEGLNFMMRLKIEF